MHCSHAQIGQLGWDVVPRCMCAATSCSMQIGVYRAPRLEPMLFIGSRGASTGAGAAGQLSATAASLNSTGNFRLFHPGCRPASANRRKLRCSSSKSTNNPLFSSAVPTSGALAGAGATLRAKAHFTGKIKYYARLLVNGHVVGTSGVASLAEDFTVAFRDLFR